MNGKAAFCFTMAGLSAVAAVFWFNDAIRELRGDVWPDAMRYYNNSAKPHSTVTTSTEPPADVH